MTIVITADEGCFIVEKALYEALTVPEKFDKDAEHINPVKEVRTSNPEDFLEITQAELDAYEVQWQVAHNPVTTETV